MNRSLVVPLAVAASLAATLPAHAFDIKSFLESTFGTSKPEELALPMFVGLAIITVLLFVMAALIGKWRQKRLIDSYNAQINAHSKALRQNLKNPRGRNF